MTVEACSSLWPASAIPRRRLPIPHSVVVVGGGVIGVTSAAELARRGLNVVLLERAPTLAGGATARNGAQLSYSYADALGAPGILRDLPRLVAGLDPAFRIRVTLAPSFIKWAVRFLANCTEVRFRANTCAVLRLALRSRHALAALRARCPTLDFQHAQPGKVHLYYSPEKFAAAIALVGLKNDLGCAQQILSVEQLHAVEPALTRCRRDVVGAIYSPLDEVGDPCQFTRQLAAQAEREHGLSVLTSTAADRFIVEKQRIRAVVTTQGAIEADLFVLAAGVGAVPLARSVDIDLPIRAMKGYSITLPATRHSPSTSVTDTRARIVFSRLQDRIRVAGIAELGRADERTDARRIDTLLEAARFCLPAAAEWSADPAAWTGLRPMTPDCRPIIGQTAVANLFVNCGHGMLGWTLACASAELLAGIMLEEPLSADGDAMVTDFRCGRL